jgi:adenosylhomocysteine nucleosidase
MSAALTAIVAALPEEIGPLRARLTGVEARWVGGRRALLGRLAGQPVVVTVTGDGAHNARQATADLLDRLPVARLLITGIAGAVTPSLAAGAVVLAKEVCGSDGRAFRPAPALLAWAAAAAETVVARVVTADAIADSRAQKARIGARYSGDGSPTVVDLESAPCADAASARAVPWLVLRAVSDTADQELPALLNRCRDDGGAVRRGRVLAAMLRQPAAVPVLLELRRRARGCAEALLPRIERLLAAWPAAIGDAPITTRNLETLP